MRSRLLWGAAAAVVYVTAALVVARSGRVLPRPLYDGLAPAAPYRFVSPPPDLAPDNEQPEPGKGVVDIVDGTSQATSISTGDGQLQVVLQKGTFEAKKKEKAVEVTITPLAPPEPLGVGGGLRIEGNAYRVEAAYAKSGDAAAPKRYLTIVLRYPFQATAMVRRDGNGWTHLKAENSAASLQLFAATNRLGVFAGAGKPHSNFWKYVPYAAGGFGVLAGIVGYLSGRRGWFRRKRPQANRATRRRTSGRKNARSKRRPGKQV